MRRCFVIFLILLFPLNAFALSMSVAQLHQPDAAAAGTFAAHADGVAFAIASDDAQDGGIGSGTDCDIDPDEPPSGADVHYIVGQATCLRCARPPVARTAPHDAAPRCHSPQPPVKPPRSA